MLKCFFSMRQFFYNPWGFILQIIAIVHFVRSRPSGYWLWIILAGGWIGSTVYVFVELVPDLGLDRPFRHYFVLRKRIEEAEGTVLDNPSPGNYEELGMVLFDDGQFARAREAYDRSITPRTDHLDPYYRRALCDIELNEWMRPLADMERVYKKENDYDFHRCAGLYAQCLVVAGRNEEALAILENTLNLSTLTETQYYYAALLQKMGRH